LRGSTYLDPLALAAAGPARLLPVWGSGAPARPVPGPPRATAQAVARPGVGTTAPQDASGAGGWGALTANGPTLLPLVLLGLAMLPLAADRPRRRRRPQRHRGPARGQSRAGSSTASRR
jgi:hypothetical protein